MKKSAEGRCGSNSLLSKMRTEIKALAKGMQVKESVLDGEDAEAGVFRRRERSTDECTARSGASNEARENALYARRDVKRLCAVVTAEGLEWLSVPRRKLQPKRINPRGESCAGFAFASAVFWAEGAEEGV